MYEFDYHRPTSLDDAASRLGDEEAKLVAGGMTLVPTLKLRLAKPTQLVDLAAIPSLTGISEDGDAVVIVGHIGGDAKPWVDGRATFLIVDPSIKPCPSNEGCPTPWDCCCVPKEELVKVMATVKVVDGQGQTVPVDARALLGLKESQTVVARGKAKRDDKGNLTVLADGLFVRP